MSLTPWTQMVKRPPPLWKTMVASLEVWLPDMATLVVTKLEGDGTPTEHGTPLEDEERFGPFRARLTAPVRQEQHQPDRKVREEQYQLTIMSDRPPEEGWMIEIRVAGGNGNQRGVKDGLYRVQGTVNPRPAPWGRTLTYNVEVQLTKEY